MNATHTTTNFHFEQESANSFPPRKRQRAEVSTLLSLLSPPSTPQSQERPAKWHATQSMSFAPFANNSSSNMPLRTTKKSELNDELVSDHVDEPTRQILFAEQGARKQVEQTNSISRHLFERHAAHAEESKRARKRGRERFHGFCRESGCGREITSVHRKLCRSHQRAEMESEKRHGEFVSKRRNFTQEERTLALRYFKGHARPDVVCLLESLCAMPLCKARLCRYSMCEAHVSLARREDARLTNKPL